MAASKDARSKLLDAAMAVIRGKGFAATSVDELCQAAGVTKGAFFHHFRSKEELGVAAAAHFGEMAAGLFAAAPYHALEDPVARLLGYVDFRREILQGEIPEYTCLLGTMVQEAYATHPAIRAACEREIVGHALTLEARHRRGDRGDRPADGLDARKASRSTSRRCCRGPSCSPRRPAMRRLPPTALATCAAISHSSSRPTAKGRLFHELR